MLKKLFSNSSIIYSELIRDHQNKKEICLVDISPQMSSFIHVDINESQRIPIDEIDFFSNNNQIDWPNIFDKVLSTNNEIVFEYDCFAMNRYMQVKVFSPEKEHLIVLFNDITDQSEVATFSETLAGMTKDHLDFDKISEYVRKISGASFSIINMFTSDNTGFVTKAISGDSKIIKTVVGLMGIKLIGHEWSVSKELFAKITLERTTRFKSFRYLTEDILPHKLVDLVEGLCDLGEVFIVSIIKDGVLVGDITFLMKKGSMFRQKRLIEGIASQIGMVIEQRRTSKELYKSKEMFKSIFQQAPFGIAVVDLNNARSYDINHRYCEITGRDKRELLEVDWKDITHPDDIVLDLAYTKDIMNGDFTRRSIEKRYLKPDGSYVWAEISIVPSYNADNVVSHHIIMCNDITYRKKVAQRNEYLSYHDELTGLYNRHFYEAELERLDAKRNLPLTVIFADVNGLKLTNDAYGHKSGDILLKQVGNIIKSECRKDEIVARVGGDEFIVLLPKTSKKQAEIIVNRLNKKLEETSVDQLILSVSFGIAVKSNINESIEHLIVIAEQKMYKNKLLISQKVKTKIFNHMIKSLHDMSADEKWHSVVIGDLSELMGVRLGFDDPSIKEIKTFGVIHDIGKVGIDSRTIYNTDKLSKQEWKEIMRHSEVGYQIVSAVNEYSSFAESILAHHERFDGKGYPNRLKGKSIPLNARILSIVDAYEAMTGNREYHSKKSTRKEAIAELHKHSGTQFDPDLVEIFCQVVLTYDDPRMT